MSSTRQMSKRITGWLWPAVQLVLISLGALLGMVTLGNLYLWQQAEQEYTQPILCSSTDMTIANPAALSQPCQAQYLPPEHYSRTAWVTGASAVACFAAAAAFVLRRKATSKRQVPAKRS